MNFPGQLFQTVFDSLRELDRQVTLKKYKKLKANNDPKAHELLQEFTKRHPDLFPAKPEPTFEEKLVSVHAALRNFVKEHDGEEAAQYFEAGFDAKKLCRELKEMEMKE